MNSWKTAKVLTSTSVLDDRPRMAQLGHRLGGALVDAIRDDDVAAFLPEAPRRRAPDSLTGPGDDAHLVLEPARADRAGRVRRSLLRSAQIEV
jgi:hypothetical protein